MSRKPIFAAAHLFPGHVEPKPPRKKCRPPRATAASLPLNVLAGMLWQTRHCLTTQIDPPIGGRRNRFSSAETRWNYCRAQFRVWLFSTERTFPMTIAPSRQNESRMTGAGRSAVEPMPAAFPVPPHLNPAPPITSPLGGRLGAALNGGNPGGAVGIVPQAVIDATGGPLQRK